MFDIHTEAYLRRTQATSPRGRTLPAVIATGMALCLGLLLALQ